MFAVLEELEELTLSRKRRTSMSREVSISFTISAIETVRWTVSSVERRELGRAAGRRANHETAYRYCR